MGPTHWIFIWDTEWNAVSVFSARFITIAGDGWRYFVEAAWNAMGFVAGREATVAGRATGVILTAENEAIEPTLHYVLGEVKVWPFDTPPLGPGFNQRYEAVMKAIEEIAAKQGRRVAPEGFLNVKLLGPGGLAAIASNIVASMAMEEISEARLNTL